MLFLRRWSSFTGKSQQVRISEIVSRGETNIQVVTDKVVAWERARNRLQTTTDWRFTNEDARIKLERLYPIVEVQ